MPRGVTDLLSTAPRSVPLRLPGGIPDPSGVIEVPSPRWAVTKEEEEEEKKVFWILGF